MAALYDVNMCVRSWLLKTSTTSVERFRKQRIFKENLRLKHAGSKYANTHLRTSEVGKSVFPGPKTGVGGI